MSSLISNGRVVSTGSIVDNGDHYLVNNSSVFQKHILSEPLVVDAEPPNDPEPHHAWFYVDGGFVHVQTSYPEPEPAPEPAPETPHA